MVAKLINRVKTKLGKKRQVKAEVRVLRAWAARGAVILLIWALGWVSGCAAVVGGVRGTIEGLRHDIEAAREVARPGTPDLGKERQVHP